jgi:transcriptional regulator with XRE-family HTH domain
LDKDFNKIIKLTSVTRNKIIKRLKYSFKEKAKYKKVTQELLAKELGFKASTFSQRKRDNSIPYEEILDLCYKYGINPQWVLFGITSEFLLTQSGDVEVSYAKHVAEQKALGINEFILPTNPSIDYLNLLFKSEYYDYIDKDKAKLFTMRDDSMEKLISPKDKVLIDIFTKMNLSFKLTTILGEIAKKYYGELDGDVKIKLIREAYSINLRAVNIFISNFEEHHELIQKTIEEHIEKKGYATSIDIGLTSKKMIFNLLSQLTEGFILKVAKSVASKDLEQIYKNIFNQEKDKISIEIIDLAIELDFPKRLNQNAPNLYKKLEKNYLAQDTVRRLVAEHIYMYHVDHRVKDSVMDQMQMEKGNVNKLKDKQQLPFDE